MPTPTKRLTAEDLLQMPDDDYKYELVEGRLIQMPPPGALHGFIAVRLAGALDRFVQKHQLGFVFTETGYKLATNPDTVRGPDVSFRARTSGAPVRPPRGYWAGPPDLAVEILSPDDRPGEIQAKVKEYLRVGVRLVWVVDPDDRTVIAYRPDTTPVTLTETQELDGGDVLPGFKYAVRRLFE